MDEAYNYSAYGETTFDDSGSDESESDEEDIEVISSSEDDADGNVFFDDSNVQFIDSMDYVSDGAFETIDLMALDDMHEQPRPASGQNAPAQITPQSGRANVPPPQSTSEGAGAVVGTGQSASIQCAICLDDMNSQNISSTPCGHLYCTPCITRAIRNDRCCPLCKKRVALNKLLRIYLPARI